MGVKVRERDGAWWLYIDHKGQRKARRVGEGQTGKRAAELAKIQIEAQLALGDTAALAAEPGDQPPTWTEVAQEWLERYPTLHPIRPGTLDRYRSLLQHHLIPYFGPRPITAITADLIEGFIQVKRTRGGSLRKDKALADGSLRGALVVLGLVLRRAVRRKLLQSNPLSEVEWRREQGPGEHVDPFTVAELRAILATAPAIDPDFATLLRLWMQSGLRAGEVQGLQRQDLDSTEGIAQVRRTFSRGRLGPTKVFRKWPVCFLHPVADATADWRPGATPESRSVLAGLKALKVQALDPEAFVFQRAGRPWPSVSLNTTWRRVLRKAGVRYREPEQLRHTWASTLLSRNAPLLYVQQQGGWRNATVLLKVYARWIPQEFASEVHQGRVPGAVSVPPSP